MRSLRKEYLKFLKPDEMAQYERIEQKIFELQRRLRDTQAEKNKLYFRGRDRYEYARKNGRL